MTSFEVDGERRLGGRELRMPLDLIASPREGEFSVPFSESIYSQLIKPYCQDLQRMQLQMLDTVGIAYIPPGAGAIFTSTGKVRKNKLGDRFLSVRSGLLQSTKRMLVDLRQVSDPEYRRELEAVGVKASPVNQRLHGSPGIGDGTELVAPKIRPKRAPLRPKVAQVSPLVGAVEIARRRPRRGPVVGEAESGQETEPSRGRTRLGIGLAAAGTVVTVASILGVSRALSGDE